MKPQKITLLDFDTRIKNVQEITEETNIFKDLKFTGRGGTDITPVLEWSAKNNPTVLLVFTDGRFYIPDFKPTCPVIWLIHGSHNFQPIFGKVINYEIRA